MYMYKWIYLEMTGILELAVLKIGRRNLPGRLYMKTEELKLFSQDMREMMEEANGSWIHEE